MEIFPFSFLLPLEYRSAQSPHATSILSSLFFSSDLPNASSKMKERFLYSRSIGTVRATLISKTSTENAENPCIKVNNSGSAACKKIGSFCSKLDMQSYTPRLAAHSMTGSEIWVCIELIMYSSMRQQKGAVYRYIILINSWY